MYTLVAFELFVVCRFQL